MLQKTIKQVFKTMATLIKKLFNPNQDYIVIKVYPDCEIRRNDRAIWVHITDKNSYFARLKQKQAEILSNL